MKIDIYDGFIINPTVEVTPTIRISPFIEKDVILYIWLLMRAGKIARRSEKSFPARSEERRVGKEC